VKYCNILLLGYFCSLATFLRHLYLLSVCSSPVRGVHTSVDYGVYRLILSIAGALWVSCYLEPMQVAVCFPLSSYCGRKIWGWTNFQCQYGKYRLKYRYGLEGQPSSWVKFRCSWVKFKWEEVKCREVEWSVVGWSGVKFLVTGYLPSLEDIQTIWSLLFRLSHSVIFFRFHFVSLYIWLYVLCVSV